MRNMEASTEVEVGRCLERDRRIPESEIRQLALRLADARDWAARGKPGLGYALLLRGLIDAEQSVIDGQRWASSLVRCWRDAIDDFCERSDLQHDE
jgi:hypothetical protein